MAVQDINVNINAVDNTKAAVASAQRSAATLAHHYNKVGNAAVTMSKNQRTATRSMRGQWGQLGQQVQDVAVQLQMGQNAMFVLAQQGSQIASLMGPGGAIAGGFLAVAAAIAGALVPSLFEANRELGRLSEEALEAVGSVERLTEVQYEAAIIEQNRKIEESLNKQKKLKADLAREEEKLKPKTQTGVMGFTSTDIVPGAAEERAKAIKEEMTLIGAEIDTAKQNAEKLTQALIDFKKERTSGEGSVWQEFLDERSFAAIEEQDKAIFKRSEELVREHTQKRRELTNLGLVGEQADLKNNFVMQQALVEEYAQKQIITEQEKADAISRINANARKSAISEFSKGVDALGQYNKKAFAISKGVKTAEAIMNTYAGANQALAAYPPPFSYIAAAGQIAFGMAQVAQIRSQSFSGRAGGGLVQGGQPYMVGEQGREMFVPSTNGTIVKNSDLTQGGGKTVNINFSITTVDARGFDELLTSRRGQIVSMVNRAMNDRGRVGVV